MTGRSYYMLVASLPHLPHFTRAERLPINPQRLGWRRNALHPDDAAELERILDLWHWRRRALTLSDHEVDRRFRLLLQRTTSPTLRALVDHRMGEESVVAALRRRQRGLAAPAADERCGIGRWDRLVRTRWERDDFGLGAAFPWMARARQCLSEGNALGLEELLMDTLWRRLSWMQDAQPFAFEAIVAYVLKWDVLDRWLSNDPARAKGAFQGLVEEALGGHARVDA
jgi:hypothetical protein